MFVYIMHILIVIITISIRKKYKVYKVFIKVFENTNTFAMYLNTNTNILFKMYFNTFKYKYFCI